MNTINTMNRTGRIFWIAVIIFSLFSNLVWAQDQEDPPKEWEYPGTETEGKEEDGMQTLMNDQASQIRYSGYGAPEVKATTFADSWGVLVGGRGGLLINRMFTVGLVGMGLAPTVKRGYTDDEGAQTAIIGMGYGGVYLEYIWGMSRIVHFSIPIDLVAIGASIKKQTDSGRTHLDKYALFGVIPRVNIEFNVTTFFIISITGGYRFAFGGHNNYMDQYDAWGPEFGLMFKFGYFSEKPFKKKSKQKKYRNQ